MDNDRFQRLKGLFPDKTDEQITNVMDRADNPQNYVHQGDVESAAATHGGGQIVAENPYQNTASVLTGQGPQLHYDGGEVKDPKKEALKKLKEYFKK